MAHTDDKQDMADRTWRELYSEAHREAISPGPPGCGRAVTLKQSL